MSIGNGYKAAVKADRVKINCSSCPLPSVEIENGEIIIYNEHRGVKHINRIPIEYILEQLEKEIKKAD